MRQRQQHAEQQLSEADEALAAVDDDLREAERGRAELRNRIATLETTLRHQIARESEPAGFDSLEVNHASDLTIDQSVAVMPTDYGFQPVTGTLQRLTPDVITIAREDERAGRLHVHFPRYGFEVSPEGDAS